MVKFLEDPMFSLIQSLNRYLLHSKKVPGTKLGFVYLFVLGFLAFFSSHT